MLQVGKIVYEVLRFYSPSSVLNRRTACGDKTRRHCSTTMSFSFIANNYISTWSKNIGVKLQKSSTQIGFLKEFQRHQRIKSRSSHSVGSSTMHWSKLCFDGSQTSCGNDAAEFLFLAFSNLHTCPFSWTNCISTLWCSNNFTKALELKFFFSFHALCKEFNSIAWSFAQTLLDEIPSYTGILIGFFFCV